MFSYRFDIDSTDVILRRRNLETGGAVQRIIDSEVLRCSEPYVPFKTGTLRNSGITGTVIGSGLVEYKAPYAKQQYYFGRTPGSAFGEPLRGRYWVERMKADHLDDIKAAIVSAIGE